MSGNFTYLDLVTSTLFLFVSLTAESVTDPMGFCFCWAGARAAYGVTSGKVGTASRGVCVCGWTFDITL